MKKSIKIIIKYFSIYISVIIFFMITLISTSLIPREKIEKNIEMSNCYEKINYGVRMLDKNKPYTYLHDHADTILLNIIYCLDVENPISSTLEAKYYGSNGFHNLGMAMQLETNGTEQYLRYWHGTMMFLRPLLVFFNVYQIHVINIILLTILLIILIRLLWKNKLKGMIVGLIIAIVLTNSGLVAFSIVYPTTYYIMFIISILTIYFELKDKKKIPILFFVSGILTYFFDFLVTEILTLGVPLLCLLGIKYKNIKNKEEKYAWITIIKCSILWIIGYAGTLIAKGAISSIVLKINAFDYIIEYALIRIGKYKLISNALINNIDSLVGFSEIGNLKVILSILGLITLSCISIVIYNFKKDKTKAHILLLIFLVGLIPYVRYILIPSHSYTHSFFTFRDQFITILSFFMIYTYGISWEKYLIKLRKNKDKVIK